ncbi:MAG: ATP-dependent protease subunit HslV [Deferribacteraceae bacterium]|jgi:ATP-dependent HslUV protease subunit HslV|nr:ATP-dependent protease subunit HslV [Deferribacteraceae bacterium]
MSKKIRSTTVIAVKRNGQTAMAADGQVTLGNTVMKGTARKVRPLADGKILTGFAGSAADAFTLLERFETKLQEHGNILFRSIVAFAKDWRMDKYLRHLEALMIVVDKDQIFTLSGNGDVIEPDDGVVAIGSGGPYALAAAKALMRNTELSAAEIAEKSLHIAGEICIYTNTNINVEVVSEG